MQQVDACSLQFVDRSFARDGKQGARRGEGPSLHMGECSIDRPADPRPRVRRQLGRAGQKRCSGSEASASLRAAGRSLELGGDLFVGPRRGSGAVPGAPIRVRAWVGGFGEGTMNAMAVVGSGSSVGCGPDEWVCELHPPADLQEPGVVRRIGRL
jgi:hypothetical protein